MVPTEGNHGYQPDPHPGEELALFERDSQRRIVTES
jgi:hypothetical protein